MFEIIIGILVLISSIILLVDIYYNKFQFTLIKMDEADNNIAILLQKKLDLLKKCRPMIKKNIKDDDFMSIIDTLIPNQMKQADLHNSLKTIYNDLFKLLDENDSLYKKKNLISIIEKINENELELVAAIKFYNDSAVIYNELIKSFPSNIIRLFFGYKERKYYNNEKREIFEILKNK